MSIARFGSLLLLIGLMTAGILAGCGHSSGGGTAPDPAKGSTWDQMKWDQGKWG